MGFHKVFLLLSLFFVLLFACKNESFYGGNDAQLIFSNDTISFDTVFTSIGTTTQRLTVYNPYNKAVRISSIRLAGAKNSDFIININGLSATNATDIDLSAKDSLIIFIQFFANPSGNNKPLLIKDSIFFDINNNTQNVKLEAFGQDVHLLKEQTIQSQEWIADKPYLIYGNITVEALSTLTIDKGAKLYFHRDANIRIKGSLIAKGDKQNPILFRGDRLEKYLQHSPAQWGGIALLPGSNNNVMDWVVIKNGISGIQIGGYNENSLADLVLSNSIIETMSYNCLLAMNAKITSYNCVFANALTYTCGMLDGGDYKFYHCTFANFYGNLSAVYCNDYDTSKLNKISPIDAKFYNSIIYGFGNEVTFDFKGTYDGIPLFENCLISKLDTTDLVHFKNTIWYNYSRMSKDTIFTNADSDSLNFTLHKLSPAQNKGNLDIGKLYPLDLNLNNRIIDNKPDIGAYEFIEK